MKKYLILIISIVLFFACEDKKENDLSLDCAGVEGGTAVLDNCENCVGGTTGESSCIEDCNGDWGGDAELDICGVCNGNNTDCLLSFSLTDRNPLSSTWNQLIGPEIYLGKVSLYYFPSSET
tara:strand:- start:80 stop:445 length:366 start_codon:yes stop_codon:yes gene_type:complete